MRLSEIFNQLAHGELANLHLADNADTIFDDKKERVLRSINLGLADLHHRFYLKRKYKDIVVSEHTKLYKIDDVDCIEIIKVKLGTEELCLNHDYVLLDTTTLQLKEYPREHETLSIEYRAKHRELNQTDIDNDAEVELPLVYLNALLLFIASRLYTSIVNQLDGDLNESNRYSQRYMQEIQLLERQGIDVDDLFEHDWFCQRGFI